MSNNRREILKSGAGLAVAAMAVGSWPGAAARAAGDFAHSTNEVFSQKIFRRSLAGGGEVLMKRRHAFRIAWLEEGYRVVERRVDEEVSTQSSLTALHPIEHENDREESGSLPVELDSVVLSLVAIARASGWNDTASA